MFKYSAGFNLDRVIKATRQFRADEVVELSVFGSKQFQASRLLGWRACVTVTDEANSESDKTSLSEHNRDGRH